MAKQGISPLEKRFCEEYVIDKNQTQAALRAGYGANSKSEKNRYTAANRAGDVIFKRPHVQAYIQKLEKKVCKETSKRLGITKETIAIELDNVIQLATESGNLAAMVRAVELKGKLVGAFTEVVDMNQHITAEMVQSMDRVLEDE